MENLIEKKWFVYIQDHHEGPFNLEDVRELMSQDKVNRGSFVWCEGMTDWKAMTEVPSFESILSNGTTPPTEPVQAIAPETPATTDRTSTDLTPKRKEVILGFARAGEVTMAGGERLFPKLLRWGFILSLAGGGYYAYREGKLDPVLKSPALKAWIQTGRDLVQPYLMMAAERFPELKTFISVIPPIDDVLADEYEELVTAASGPIEAGPRLAVALSRSDLALPRIYVSSNLPAETAFEIYVQGVGETLLNQIDYSAKKKVKLENHLAATQQFENKKSRPFARGEYVVYVVESDKQVPEAQAALSNLPKIEAKLPAFVPTGRKLISVKTYFLGGVRDQNYTERLKEFHDKLRSRAKAELMELRQFEATLSSQFKASVSNFNSLKAKPVTTLKKSSWNDFHGRWERLSQQFEQTFSKWTPETMEAEFFYWKLFNLTRQSHREVILVHQLQASHFNRPMDASSFDIELGQASSRAELVLSTLRAKIDQTEKLSPTPNGMPRRLEE